LSKSLPTLYLPNNTSGSKESKQSISHNLNAMLNKQGNLKENVIFHEHDYFIITTQALDNINGFIFSRKSMMIGATCSPFICAYVLAK